jgi:hypothetical protein
MSISAKLGEIRLDEPSTRQDKLFLTLDIDWVNDEILANTCEVPAREVGMIKMIGRSVHMLLFNLLVSAYGF